MIGEKESKTWRLYLWLAGVSLYVSSVTFGGGYVVIPLLRRAYVEKKKLFTEDELMDMAAVAQSSPGAIAINLTGLCGYRVAGTLGTVICCVAAVTPPIVILTVISVLYDAFRSSQVIAAILKGMEAGVAAIMLDFVIDLCKPIFGKKNFLLSALVPAAFICSFFLQIHVALVLAISVILVIGEGLITRRRKSDETYS